MVNVPDTYKIEDMYLKHIWIIVCADRELSYEEVKIWTRESLKEIRQLRDKKGIK